MAKKIAAEIMSRGLVDICAGEALSNVIKIFDESGISGAPVTNLAGNYIGVISKTDLVSYKLVEMLQAGQSIDALTVQDFMHFRTPISVAEDASIYEVLSLMLRNRVHRVFVRNEQGRLVGAISTLNMLHAFDMETLMAHVAS